MNRIDYICLMAKYNDWMNTRLYEATKGLPDEAVIADRNNKKGDGFIFDGCGGNKSVSICSKWPEDLDVSGDEVVKAIKVLQGFEKELFSHDKPNVA